MEKFFNLFLYNNFINLPTGDIKQNIFSHNSDIILIDKTPPQGKVIIEKNTNNTEIKIFKFIAYNNTTIISNTAVIEDIEEKFVKYVTNINIEPLNVNIFESIGVNNNYILKLIFSAPTTVSSIEICAIAQIPKEYIIEINKNNNWIPIIELIASNFTTDVLTYTFKEPENNISMIRIVYKGDYYTYKPNGNVFITAKDNISNIIGFQISRFSDFRDVKQIIQELNMPTCLPPYNDWINYNFNKNLNLLWNYLISDNIWNKLTFYYNNQLNVNDNIIKIIYYNNNLFCISNSNLYLYNTINHKIISINVPEINYVITDIVLYNNCIYISILKDLNSKIYSLHNNILTEELEIKNKKIVSLASFANKLYIGCNTNDIYSNYNSIEYINFNKKQTTTIYTIEKKYNILHLSVVKNILYITTNQIENNICDIYYYNGNAIQHSIRFNANYISPLIYSSINNSIWMGDNNGNIYTATISGNNINWNIYPYNKIGNKVIKKIISIDDILIENNINYQYIIILTDKDICCYTYIKENNLTDELWEFFNYPNNDIINDFIYINKNIYAISISGHIYNINRQLIGHREKYVYVKFLDQVGNITNNYIYDKIIQGSDNIGITGLNKSDGKIYQIDINTAETKIINIPEGSVLSPYQELYTYGEYISYPINILGLKYWENIDVEYIFPEYTLTDEIKQLYIDNGFAIYVYIKTAKTLNELIKNEWKEINYINTISQNITARIEEHLYTNLKHFSDNWLQYKLKMISAVPNKTPIIKNVKLHYSSLEYSYFYTTEFNLNKWYNNYHNFIPNYDFTINGIKGWESNDSEIILYSDYYNNTDTKKALNIVFNNTNIDKYVYSMFFINPDYIPNITSNEQYIFYGEIEYRYRNTNSNLVAMKIFYNGINEELLYEKILINSFEWTKLTFELIIEEPILKQKIYENNKFEVRFYKLNSNYNFEIFIKNIYIGTPYTNNITNNYYRRGILTANYKLNDGSIKFGYITQSNNFNFNEYTPIEINKIFEIDGTPQVIRFGVAMQSGYEQPVILHNIGLQLDIGNEFIKFMETPKLN